MAFPSFASFHLLLVSIGKISYATSVQYEVKYENYFNLNILPLTALRGKEQSIYD
jgi:hypothetical protein